MRPGREEAVKSTRSAATKYKIGVSIEPLRSASFIINIMLKHTYLSMILGCLFFSSATANETSRPTKPASEASDERISNSQPITIPDAEQFDLRSKSGRVYRIFIAAPREETPEPGLPVIYFSDANSNFPLLHASVRGRAGNGPRAILVGIGYPEPNESDHRERRAFDLTSKVDESSAEPAPGRGPGFPSGGNDAFLRFIQDELKPVVERKYRIDRNRQALFGHSFGGLFVLHVLLTEPKAFQTYLASSPSVWWNRGEILEKEKAFLAKHAKSPLKARVFISFGEWEQNPEPGTDQNRAEMLARLRSAGTPRDFATALKEGQVEGVEVVVRELPEEGHGSAVVPAASRAVRFALGEP